MSTRSQIRSIQFETRQFTPRRIDISLSRSWEPGIIIKTHGCETFPTPTTPLPLESPPPQADFATCHACPATPPSLSQPKWAAVPSSSPSRPSSPSMDRRNQILPRLRHSQVFEFRQYLGSKTGDQMHYFLATDSNGRDGSVILTDWDITHDQRPRALMHQDPVGTKELADIRRRNKKLRVRLSIDGVLPWKRFGLVRTV